MVFSFRISGVPAGFNFRKLNTLKVNPITASFLVLVNLLPVYGVLFQGWNLGQLLVLYWAESGVIGFYNILKILRSNVSGLQNSGLFVSAGTGASKIFISALFSLHFSIFMLVHFTFIFTIFKPEISTPALILIPLLGFFISHGISYYLNFIKKQEYLSASPTKQMGAPYFRIMIMHFTIIIGAFLTQFLGQAIFVLLLFIGLKTISDLYFHGLEHTRLISGSDSTSSQQIADTV